MKKLLIVAIAAAMALALAACGSSAPASSSASSEASESAASASSSSASASSASASSASALTLTWYEAKTADLAAKGAGVDTLGVPSSDTELSIGKVGSDDWTYLYTKDMAEADGSIAAAALVVRKSKSVGDNTAELSTYTKDWAELADMVYAHTWNLKVGETDVTCFGNVEGKASKMTWKQDSNGYSVLVLGQGDNWSDFGIADDDVKTLVGAVIAANTKPAESKSAESKPAAEPASEQAAPAVTQAEVEQMVFNNGLGQLTSFAPVQDANGNWTIELTSLGADGVEYLSVLDMDGNVLVNGYEAAHGNDGADTDGAADVEQMVWNAGLGEFVSYEQTVDANGEVVYEVVTRGVDGNEYASVLDADGNVLENGWVQAHGDEGDGAE